MCRVCLLSQVLPFSERVPGVKAPTYVRMQGEPLNISEAGPKGQVYIGEHSDSIKWHESKGQHKCIFLECLQ